MTRRMETITVVAVVAVAALGSPFVVAVTLGYRAMQAFPFGPVFLLAGAGLGLFGYLRHRER